MVAMGLLICFKVDWETPLPMIGIVPTIYSVVYLLIRGLEDENK